MFAMLERPSFVRACLIIQRTWPTSLFLASYDVWKRESGFDRYTVAGKTKDHQVIFSVERRERLRLRVCKIIVDSEQEKQENMAAIMTAMMKI